MDTEGFNMILSSTLTRIEEVLGAKAGEYATEDRLHNFNVAAALQNITPAQALAGMMAKHTVSVYDMLDSDREFELEMWDEKIIDHINYLILLRCIVYNNYWKQEQKS